MRRFHKPLALLSVLGLGLGFGACSSEKNTPEIVVPSESNKLTTEEAQVNTNSISVLRSAEQAGLKIKQISSLPTGQVGYNVLLSDERLVKVYTATSNTARSLRVSPAPTLVENPIKSVDLGTKGVAVFNLADGSKITLNRVGAGDQGALAVNQSVAPESKFLFSLLEGDKQLLAKTHTPAKSVTIRESEYNLTQVVVYNEMGYPIRIQETITSDGGGEVNLSVFNWLGERLTTIESRDERNYEGGTNTVVKLALDYNQFNQAILKSLTFNGKDREAKIEYNLSERRVVAISLDDRGHEDKTESYYDEYFRLVKEVDYSRTANVASSQWKLSHTTIYTYDSKGDIKTEESESTISNYVYEYDAKGNWTKRTGTMTSKDGSWGPSTRVITREIVY